jgi:alpha-1,2-mannosyltransferase
MRTLFLWIGVTLTLVGCVVATVALSSALRSATPLDFNVNWVAARRLIEGRALYDRAASRAEAIRALGTGRQTSIFSTTNVFGRFVGSPVTALLHVPFLLVGHSAAITVFRALAFVGMVGAIVVTADALAPASRFAAALVGVGALLVSFPLVNAIALGQGPQFVMLGIAATIWGTARRRWAIAGVGLGVATILKISPVILLVYLLVRGYRRVALWSGATMAVLLGAAAVVGRPTDVVVWVRDVVPVLSRATPHVWNQSLVAWLARIFSRTNPLTQPQLHGWYQLSPVIAVVAIVGLWRYRSGCPVDSIELGLLTLVALLMGPLTWDHYTVWAIVPLVVFCDLRYWVGRSRRESLVLLGALAVATTLLTVSLERVWADAGGASWGSFVTSPRTVALLLYLAVGARLIVARSTSLPRASALLVEQAQEEGTFEVANIDELDACEHHSRLIDPSVANLTSDSDACLAKLTQAQVEHDAIADRDVTTGKLQAGARDR